MCVRASISCAGQAADLSLMCVLAEVLHKGTSQLHSGRLTEHTHTETHTPKTFQISRCVGMLIKANHRLAYLDHFPGHTCWCELIMVRTATTFTAKKKKKENLKGGSG